MSARHRATVYGGMGGAVERRAAKGNSVLLRCAALLMYSSTERRGMNAGMLDRRANAWWCSAVGSSLFRRPLASNFIPAIKINVLLPPLPHTTPLVNIPWNSECREAAHIEAENPQSARLVASSLQESPGLGMFLDNGPDPPPRLAKACE